MADRFERLFELPKNLYTQGSPVIISAGALLKDTQSGNVIAQIKFQSVAEKTIRALKLSLSAYDVSGKKLQGVSDYHYLELNVAVGEDFGSNKAIVMPIAVTRSFNVETVTVIFKDGSLWESTIPFEYLPKALPLNFENAELEKQYRISTSGSAAFVPSEHMGLWQCSCGNWNSRSYCSRCRINKDIIFSALNIDSLTEKMVVRLAEEEKRRNQQLLEQAALQDEIRKRNSIVKKTASIIVPIAIAILLFAFWLYPSILKPKSQYAEAMALIDQGNTLEAIFILEELGDYKDSKDQILEIYYQEANQLLAQKDYINAARTFEHLGEYKDSAQCAIDAWYGGQLRTSISTGYAHTLGLRTDGTVVATGSTKYGRCDVSDWTDIVSVAAGGYHSVGLKADGTVVAVGDMEYGECDVQHWTNIVSIAACERITIGLKENGTIVFTGEIDRYELDDLRNLTNVAAIYANSSSIFVLTKDGTITWTNGIQIWKEEYDFISFANDGSDNYAGLRSDGTVLIGGRYPTDVTGFDQIAQLACGHDFTAGVRRDGTVILAGTNQNVSECENWNDVVLIDAEGINGGHVVALRSDGTVVATGDNKYGECDVSDWNDIVVPRQILFGS